MNQRERIAIGLGSNLGDRLALLRTAANILKEEILADPISSAVYETLPWGGVEQPKYLNAVVVGTCEWKPPALLNFFKEFERSQGRVGGVRWGPRLLDLDLLCYGQRTWEAEDLIVPHLHLPERDFVLLPLSEIWPDWVHPKLGVTAKKLWDDLKRHQLQLPSKVASPLF